MWFKKLLRFPSLPKMKPYAHAWCWSELCCPERAFLFGLGHKAVQAECAPDRKERNGLPRTLLSRKHNNFEWPKWEEGRAPISAMNDAGRPGDFAAGNK